MDGRDPIVVDLDGSLLRTDLLFESAAALLRTDPLSILRLPFWLLKGRAHLKRTIAERVQIDVATLPVNEPVLAFVEREHASGRTLILATAGDALLATQIGRRFKIFSRILGSDGNVNLKGRHKLDGIRSVLGPQTAFEYVGDSRSDLAIFREASLAHLVHPTVGLLNSAKRAANIGLIFRDEQRTMLSPILKTLRVHQWAKNLLLFLPVILAHTIDTPVLLTVLLGFFAFCLVASGGYIVNDLLDLEFDRRHPINRGRPIAGGRIGVPQAIFLMLVCFLSGITIAAFALTGPFVGILVLYAASSIAYSLYLKRLLVVDVLILASLYSIRIIAGGIAADVPISGWLISFSIFFFLGLALLKRFVEFSTDDSTEETASVRAYSGSDQSLIGTFGMVSGMLAVLVFVLYLNSSEVVVLYSRPQLLWWVNIPLIYWTMRMWFNASRGLIHTDPIVSALKDPVSYLCAGATVILLFLAI